MMIPFRTMALMVLLAIAGCQTAEERAAADDATCRGYGAARGSDIYVSCRMMQDQNREARQAQAAAVLAASVAAQKPKDITCHTLMGTTHCTEW